MQTDKRSILSNLGLDAGSVSAMGSLLAPAFAAMVGALYCAGYFYDRTLFTALGLRDYPVVALQEYAARGTRSMGILLVGVAPFFSVWIAVKWGRQKSQTAGQRQDGSASAVKREVPNHKPRRTHLLFLDACLIAGCCLVSGASGGALMAELDLRIFQSRSCFKSCFLYSIDGRKPLLGTALVSSGDRQWIYADGMLVSVKTGSITSITPQPFR